MAKGDDIEDRLINFAVRIIKVCGSLPETPEARHVRGQLSRSGAAPAPHYAEARGAESTRDFIHKLGICLKEINESKIWLLVIQRSEMLPAELLTAIIQEADELAKIISTSIRTARNNNQNRRTT
ncbi:MAG: four helix bundle protein [Caldilineaceae bacterium]|nr:four helix bundle protein [Caldilineaceae bacterium]